jgi:hypothetical protein
MGMKMNAYILVGKGERPLEDQDVGSIILKWISGWGGMG